MKPVNNFFTFIIIALIFIGGCKKEKFGDQQPGNNPPIANAGVDKVIVLPVDSVEIFGSGTDADGTIANYGWRKISGPNQYTLIISTQQNIKIKNLVEGLYKFELKVTDNLGASANDTVNVSVIRLTANNQPPVANAGPDKVLTLPVDSTELIGSGTDADGSIIDYTWRKVSGPADYNIFNVNAATTKIGNLKRGTYTFELAVTDNGGLIARDSMNLVVNDFVNQPPVANAGPDLNIKLPTNRVVVNGKVSDPDGNIMSIEWSKVSGPSFFTIVSPNEAVTEIKNLTQGVYVFKLEAIDSANLISSDLMSITVSAANLPPIVNAGPDLTTILPNDSVLVNGIASDPDGTIISVHWSKISGPSSYQIGNANSAVTKIKNLVAGLYIFQIEATDYDGAKSADIMQVTVVSNNGSQSPIANAGDDIYVIGSEDSVLLSGSGVDPNGGPLTYHWSVVVEPPYYPTYLTIVNPNSASTLVRRLYNGLYIFKLEVTNNAGLTGADTVEVIYDPWGYRKKSSK